MLFRLLHSKNFIYQQIKFNHKLNLLYNKNKFNKDNEYDDNLSYYCNIKLNKFIVKKL
jgi:hypothetical protein